MQKKPEIQYVDRFYTYGSGAVKVQPERKIHLPALPRIHLEKLSRVYIDPIAFLGSVLTVVMIAVLIFGAFHLRGVQEEYNAVSQTLADLKRSNASLSHSYHTSFDADTIRTRAEKYGMIDAGEAETITITFSIPEQEKEETLWDEIGWFLSELFYKAKHS